MNDISDIAIAAVNALVVLFEISRLIPHRFVSRIYGITNANISPAAANSKFFALAADHTRNKTASGTYIA